MASTCLEKPAFPWQCCTSPNKNTEKKIIFQGATDDEDAHEHISQVEDAHEHISQVEPI